MLRLTGFIFTLLAFPCIALAQDNIPIGCPDILVTGPAGIVLPGENASFTVNVGNLNGNQEPKFKWSVTGGEIVSRNDERTIRIRFNGKTTVVATVEVLGLPTGCPAIASETLSQCGGLPVAVGLFRLQTEAKLSDTEADAIADNLKENPSDQLYIQSGYIQGRPTQALEAKERDVGSMLMARGISADRITFVGVFADKELMKFYRVPPGAENPRCEECEEAERNSLKVKCPSVSVLGPAGVIRPGESITFSVNVEIGDPGKFSYSWLVSGGEISEGQGTPSIRVSTSQADNGTTLKATVKVLELATQCVNTVEGEAIVQDGGSPIMLDEFGRMSTKQIRERLDLTAYSFNEQPTWVYYFILYFPEKESPKRIAAHEKLIRDHLIVKHKIPTKQLVVLSGGTRQTQSTQIYFFPSQAPAPIP